VICAGDVVFFRIHLTLGVWNAWDAQLASQSDGWEGREMGEKESKAVIFSVSPFQHTVRFHSFCLRDYCPLFFFFLVASLATPTYPLGYVAVSYSVSIIFRFLVSFFAVFVFNPECLGKSNPTPERRSTLQRCV
jgi:hypothetical protein